MEQMIAGTVPSWANSGYGYGSGSGYGYGYGYGYGDGDGDGDGDGYGDGYGSGDGSGYGYGSGDGSYWLSCIKYFAAKWTTAQQSRLEVLQASGAKIAFWRSDKTGCACNGGRSDPVVAGSIQETAGPLRLCGAGTLHATLIPPKWQGDRWWIVALIGEVIGDDEKYGALKREIIGEAL